MFQFQNGAQMWPNTERKLRAIRTWARWAASGRPMNPHSLQNGTQETPKTSKMDP